MIICINSYSACLSFLKFLDGILWGQPQPPHTSNLDLEVKVTGIWTCPRLLVSTPTVSTSKSYVTSFSSYYIHKLVCPHCPLTCRGDANTPSTFLQPRDKNRLTGHRFSLSYFSSAVAVSLHRNFLCSATRMKVLLYNHNENKRTLPSDCNGIWIQFSVCIWKHLYAEYLQHTQTLPVCRDLLITDWQTKLVLHLIIPTRPHNIYLLSNKVANLEW